MLPDRTAIENRNALKAKRYDALMKENAAQFARIEELMRALEDDVNALARLASSINTDELIKLPDVVGFHPQDIKDNVLYARKIILKSRALLARTAE